MSRRPLGASLPPAERLVAYERRIRDYQGAIVALEAAMEALDACPPRDLDRCAGAVRGAFVELQEVNERVFRRRETVARRQAPAERAR